MHKEEIINLIYDALYNEKEIKKVKIIYQTGEQIKFDFENENVEVIEVIENDDKNESDDLNKINFSNEDDDLDDDNDDVDDDDDNDDADNDNEDNDNDNDESKGRNGDALDKAENIVTFNTAFSGTRRVKVINRP